MPKRYDAYKIDQYDIRVFRQRVGGNWYAEFYDKETQKRPTKSLGTSNKALATQSAMDIGKDILRKRALGQSLVAPRFDSCVSEWLAEQAAEVRAKKRSDKTYQNARGYIKRTQQYVTETYGERTLITNISVNGFFEYYQWRLKQNPDLSAGYINDEKKTQIQFGYWCVKKHYLTKDTQWEIDYLHIDKRTRKRVQTFKTDEVASFNTYLNKVAKEHKDAENTNEDRAVMMMYFWFNIGRLSGMRKHEMARMTVDAIPQDKLGDDGNIYLKIGENSKEGFRTVACSNEIAPFLKQALEYRIAAKRKVENNPNLELHPKDNVFLTARNTAGLPSDPTWHKYIGFAKLDEMTIGRRLNPNCLRHYYATDRILNGFTKDDLAFNMGTSVKHIDENYAEIFTEQIGDRITKRDPFAKQREFIEKQKQKAKDGDLGQEVTIRPS